LDVWLRFLTFDYYWLSLVGIGDVWLGLVMLD